MTMGKITNNILINRENFELK